MARTKSSYRHGPETGDAEEQQEVVEVHGEIVAVVAAA
jgi:hypothetical protein